MARRTRSFLCLVKAAVFLHVVCCCSKVNASCFPALFNFGDSTSDTGGIHASFPSHTPAEFSPYGETYFHEPKFRYSDGRVLIDFIAQGLGLPFLDPYLESVTSNFAHGVNFATAGATVQSVTFLTPFSLDIQVLQFLQFQQNVRSLHDAVQRNAHGAAHSQHNLTYSQRKLVTSMERLPPIHYFSDALYTISIGGNDFTYGYNQGQSIADVEAYLPKVVDGVNKAIQTLYNAGAKNFLVWDIEPQGCLPYMLTFVKHNSSDLDRQGCLDAYNAASSWFNGKLKQSLDTLRPTLSGANVIYLSQYDLKMDLIKHNLSRNGFFYVLQACCGVPSAYNYNLRVNCGSSKKIGSVTYTAVTCSDPSQYLVWDGVHNTEAANRYIAEQIFSGKYFSPSFPLLTSTCNLTSIQ